MNYYPNNIYANPYMNNNYPYNLQNNQSISQPRIEQPQYTQPAGLQGKSVDSIDVVKAMDIPLDGSISYFPIADGTAIVTKQLQRDGTSKTIVYKPLENEEIKTPKFITSDELDEAIGKVNNTEWKDEIKALKKQIRDLTDEIKELKDKEE